MIVDQKKFYSGAVLLVAFTVVLIVIFMPIFNGQNGLSYLDSLYNSISKGSANYIPKLKKETRKYSGRTVSFTVTMADERQASETEPLFAKGGASIDKSGAVLKIRGDLGAMIENCLEDANFMFGNDGSKIKQKYGYDERRVLYNWWRALKETDKNLKKQKKFSEANFITAISKKAVECTYNYYGIEAQNISDKYGLVIFSLVFYVVYTLWYGFGILTLLEGLGLQLDH